MSAPHPDTPTPIPPATDRAFDRHAEPLDAVRAFWATAACGSHFIEDGGPDAEFFRAYSAYRYRKEWHIPAIVPFADAAGKDVLEIGCGNGADGVLFASQGAHYTGVDLTETAVGATRRHFALLGLEGTFQVENAERLTFPDDSFDFVYAWGVLHHTPDIEAALGEIHRVLRTAGTAIVMVYHRASLNYWLRIMGYMRLRAMLTVASRRSRWVTDRAAASAAPRPGIRGNADPDVWEHHYHAFLRSGWGYFRAQEFLHHCTDGPECPLAKAFTKTEARALFHQFRHVEMQLAHLPLRSYPPGRYVPLAVEQWLSRRVGWNLVVTATK